MPDPTREGDRNIHELYGLDMSLMLRDQGTIESVNDTFALWETPESCGDIGGLVCEGILLLKYRKRGFWELTSHPHPFPAPVIFRPLEQTLWELRRNIP